MNLVHPVIKENVFGKLEQNSLHEISKTDLDQKI